MFKLFWTIIVICFIVVAIVSIVYGVAIIQVLQHPELIGQFFGKIVQGFNSVSVTP
jgi:uncharacterized BrkB/YihY/UPF0761 family membrane protein